MRDFTRAVTGVIVGPIVAFICYWTVFIFFDVIERFSTSADVEESHIFTAFLVIGALVGGVIGFMLSLIPRRQQQQNAEKED